MWEIVEERWKWNKFHSHEMQEIMNLRWFPHMAYCKYAQICLNSREYASIPLDKTQQIVYKVLPILFLQKTDESLDDENDAIRLCIFITL